MARSSWQLAWRLNGVVLPLLFLFLAAPPRADASCGDYLQVHRPDNVAERTPHPPPEHGSLPLPGRPCDGPNCSKGDPTPSLPSPAAPVVLRDQWACLTAGVPPVSPDGDRVNNPVTILPTGRRLGSVYRPPRP
jgi:hypothetical protein